MTEVVLTPEQEPLALAIGDMYQAAAAARLLNEQDDDDFAAVGRALETPPSGVTHAAYAPCSSATQPGETAAILRELVPLQHAAVQAA